MGKFAETHARWRICRRAIFSQRHWLAETRLETPQTAYKRHLDDTSTNYSSQQLPRQPARCGRTPPTGEAGAPAFGPRGAALGPALPRSSQAPSPRVVATRSGGGCSASPPARAVAIAEGSLPSPPGALGLGLALTAAALRRGSSTRPASPSLPSPPRAARSPGAARDPPGAGIAEPRWAETFPPPGKCRRAARRGRSPAFLPSPRPGARERPGQPPPASREQRLLGRWLIVCSLGLLSSTFTRGGKVAELTLTFPGPSPALELVAPWALPSLSSLLPRLSIFSFPRFSVKSNLSLYSWIFFFKPS